MKVTDYIIEFLIEKGIKDVFGYPGGMVTHLMDSFSKYERQIQAHVCYHEQAAAFEACAYAQVLDKVSVAYATSGPGATNLITGICNAYFDSIPVIFITGQVNTFESKGTLGVRQRGFQETDIVEMVKGVTKYAVYVESADKISYYLEKAYEIAVSGRKGPVLLDIPMNVQSSEIDLKERGKCRERSKEKNTDYSIIEKMFQTARRPCIVMGAALKSISKKKISEFVEYMGVPVITSMIAVDLLATEHCLNYGFIGAYGSRTANFVVAKSDLVLVLGARMDVRQVGGKRENFAPDAKIIRVDIDEKELDYHIREDEVDILADAEDVIAYLMQKHLRDAEQYLGWLEVCDTIRTSLHGLDKKKYNLFVEQISKYVPEKVTITTDVGQNQVWVAQSFRVKNGQSILFSGGHGAMGYSLPAAIGAWYATRRPVVCFNGDGGIQMNLQELEFIHREKLPIKIFVFNNYALGMIRHFQEMYFKNNYMQTVNGRGYAPPDFEAIARAYSMSYISYEKIEDVTGEFMATDGSVLVEVKLPEDTYVFPKLEFGKPNQDQEPLLNRELYHKLMKLEVEYDKERIVNMNYEKERTFEMGTRGGGTS